MLRQRLLYQLLPTYLVVILLCVVGVSAVARHSVRFFHIEKVKQELAAKCRMAAQQLQTPLADANADMLEPLTLRLSMLAGVRLTVIAPSGRVLSESDTDAGMMEDHANRPEVLRALAGNVADSTRFSETLHAEMLYVAVPVRTGTGVIGVVRAARSLADVQEELSTVSRRIWLGGLAVAVVAAGLGMWVSGRTSSALKEITDGAERFANGDLTHRLPEPNTVEFALLAAGLNQMAAGLRRQIETISRQNREHEAVLASMMEGVVAVDRDQRIISLNEAAAAMLNADSADFRKRTLPEMTRNVLLQRFVDGVLAGRAPAEAEIVFHDGPERHVLVRGNMLRDAEGGEIGALMVMTDLTRVRRLESVQRDFVAAVSHELRTPVTAIQGFAETLHDGAIEDPERAAQFVEILNRQAARLGRIIEDLLALCRVEQGVAEQTIDLRPTGVHEVLQAAVADCAPRAAERGVRVEVACPEGLKARMNPRLIEQAVVNLLDNAVKYSPRESVVVIKAGAVEGGVAINVRDPGCGIPAQHLERIFEPFYCVDKSRSRELGGTGLGLAIVQHIARVHGGRVTVESRVGEGSTFSLFLPV